MEEFFLGTHAHIYEDLRELRENMALLFQEQLHKIADTIIIPQNGVIDEIKSSFTKLSDQYTSLFDVVGAASQHLSNISKILDITEVEMITPEVPTTQAASKFTAGAWQASDVEPPPPSTHTHIKSTFMLLDQLWSVIIIVYLSSSIRIRSINSWSLCQRLFEISLLLDFSLYVKAATLIFISGCGLAISSAKEGKSGFIYNLVKS